MRLKKVIEIFRYIQSTKSLNDKKEILNSNKDNELFKKCLSFLLDDNVVTGISDKKISKYDSVMCERLRTIKLNTFEDVMDYLKQHNSGRDEDITNVKGFIYDHYIEDDYEFVFFIQMITKKFRLGCDAKVVNRVIPGLIPTFDVMLGTPIDKCKLKGNEWISISRKLNGTRCAFIGTKCITRQGKEYTGLQHIVNDLQLMGYSDMFVDGELIYKNPENLSDSESFQKGTGIAMSKDLNKTQLKLVVFDMFPLNEFWDGKSKEKYLDRNNKYLMKLDSKIRECNVENIELVRIVYEGFDHAQIKKWLDYAEENDWEGIICNLDANYECKRTKNLIKVKKFFTCDIFCTSVEEGDGRNKETLGALVCDYKGNKVNVGSGFSDEERKRLWKNPNDVVGHIVSIKYKEETKNKDGGVSVQFPVFEGIRFDKTEPSYN